MVNSRIFGANDIRKSRAINSRLLTKNPLFFNKPKKINTDVTFAIIASLTELVCLKNHNEYIYSIVKQEIS
jgi:hypothetical protein